MCVGWLSEYSLWYLGCLQGVFCRFTLGNHTVGSMAPFHDTISFDSLSSQQLRGAWIPCPTEESSSLASAHSSSSSVTHGASLECRYPSLEILPSKPAGCPGWLSPMKPSCCCPSLLPWHSRQLWSLFPSSGFMHSHFGCTTQPQTSTGIHYRGQSNSGTVGV